MLDIKDNVIDFFKNSPVAGDDVRKSFFKGYPYIKLTKDSSGNSFNEKSLRDYAKKVSYIVTVMRNKLPGVALFKYIVPQTSLTEFLTEFKKNNAGGAVIDIERYIPEDLA